MRTPALFISHGSPAVALERDGYARALGEFARKHASPRAIVALSAHWESEGPARVTAAPRPSLLYDFAGFPEALTRIRYDCPGEPDLAREVVDLLKRADIAASLDVLRGLDHGVWVPLRFLYPRADRPVVEVSLPVPRSPRGLLTMGEALASLRASGVLLLGSGGVVHNLETVIFEDKGAPVEPWAASFDTWVRERLEARDFEAIASYRERAPHADLAVPTSEHFDPIFFALGAASPEDRPVTVYEGFQHGTLSMRSFALCAEGPARPGPHRP